MAINGFNRLVIADESGALTGRPLASARAAAEQVAVEKVTEAKNEIRSTVVQEANQVAAEKVAAVKSEAVQAAKDSVQSVVADAIAPVVSTTIPAAVESGVRQHAGSVADERIQATVPGMIQSQAATVVESQLNEKLPSAVQVVNGRAYSMPEGTDIAWFFLLNNVTHPEGVTWQTKNGAAPASGLVILVRAGEHLYGIVPGADNVPPPSALRVEASGTSLTVIWDTVAGATGYQIAIDGSSPASANPGHVFTVRAGQSGIIQVRTVKGDKHSAWAQLSYQAAEAPKPGEKPIQWIFTWANGGWKDGDMKTGVLREYFWAPGLKTPDGKAMSYERPVSSKTGEPLEAPNNAPIQRQSLVSPSGMFVNVGSYAVISWTGEGAKIEASANGGGDTWERSAVSIEKRAVSTAPKSDGSGREYINATAGYDLRWTNTDTRGYENRDVKPNDKGIELKREGNVMVYSVIRADGSHERLQWFPYSDLRSSSGIELHGGTWGEITGVFYDAS